MLRHLKSFSLPEIELRVLDFWKKNQIVEKSLNRRKGKQRFVFFEGPPTANAAPAIHHLLARAFKDVVPRYKTMQGFYVPRQAGWDTHGLPVEIQVEKALGFKSKKDIERFGIAAFNKKCKESVWHFKEEWERFTERIGFWLDLKNPYITYEPKYIESLWWIIGQFFKKKLMYKGYKVAPWCTRCGTTLSSHELAQGYQEDTDDSVYLKFKLKKGQKIGGFNTNDSTYILSWTTTPWTLPGNVALAVRDDIKYVLLEVGKEIWILAEEIYKRKPTFLEGLGGKEPKVIKGKDLTGLSYEPLFKIKSLENKKAYKIYDAEFVTTEDGSGVVHTAVMYGEDDYQLGLKAGLPQHHTVDEYGKFTREVPGLGGLYVKDKETEKKIFAHLKENDNLIKVEPFTHEYPHCWRCNTPLLYYARTSWFVAMSRLRKELLKENDKINWVPAHFKKGRFGEWLEEVKDWNFSRERYWGTPIPIWVCGKCGNEHSIGSVDELESIMGESKNRYFLVRHGEAENNVKNISSTWPEKAKHHLTLRGRIQVEKAGRRLKKEGADLVFSSDITRARETAEIIGRVVGTKKIVLDKRLREINTGDFNGRHNSDYDDYFSSDIEKFTKRPPSGETLTELREKVFSLVWELEKKHSGKTIVLVSHEYPIWMLYSAMAGVSDEEAIREHEKRGDDFIGIAESEEVKLRYLPRDESGQIDLHRPFVDQVTWKCKKCGGQMLRTPEVADVWFDSGSMPLAAVHYPFENKKLIDDGLNYPADYISEAVDQTRGWFYTLLAVGTALKLGTPYKNVICLGHLNDKFGKKMSKSKGNVVNPWEMMEKYGVDPLRWYLYTATPPGEPKNFDEIEVAKTLRRFFFIVYNSFVFYESAPAKNSSGSHVLDKWILARLSETIKNASENLESYDIGGAGKVIESLVDDLSRWYIRRSRKRVGMKKTLGVVLFELSKLMAPLSPFFAEALYQSLGVKAGSVHLENWPIRRGSGQATTDKKLIQAMAEVRELAALGLAKRSEVGIKVRQPLSTMKIRDRISLTGDLEEILREEVNVKKIIFDAKIKEAVELDTYITTELREEGLVREFTRLVQDLRQEAKLNPGDKIHLMIETSADFSNILKNNLKVFSAAVGARTVDFKKGNKFDAEIETQVSETKAWLALKKIR